MLHSAISVSPDTVCIRKQAQSCPHPVKTVTVLEQNVT